MKKLLLLFFIVLSFSGFSQSITEVLYPRWVQGVGSGTPSQDRKVPYACRMTLTGLTPNATYRYYSRFVFNPGDGTNGIGVPIIVNQTGNFLRVTVASLGTVGGYGEFTTNGSGSYTGWFVIEPSTDPDFQPGTQLFWRIMLNDGAGGTSVSSRVTATNFVTVLNWGTSQTTNGFVNGSAFWGATNAAFIPKNFIMLYDNIAGTGRPVTSTFIEADGTANTSGNGYVPYYSTLINEQANRWGTIIPNDLANGINNISQYNLSDGNILNSCTSANGVYPSINQTGVAGTTDTKNANWGLTVLYSSASPRNVNCTPGATCSINLSTVVTNVTCFGGSTGAVNLTVNGAAAPVTYLWSNGATTEDISGLAAGTYSVTVTDANSCSQTTSATVTQPASALSAGAVASNGTCGLSNGSVNLTVTGGTTPYTFLWSNGATTEDISGLAAGTYSVTVTDANGCTTTASATVTNPGSPAVAIAGTTNVLCFGQTTGAINITVSGGTTPYTYLWSNGATTEDISGLAAGTYNVTVTDAAGCTATGNAMITQPASALNAGAVASNATCGASNGSINLTVTGGTSPYTFLWSNGATTEDITGLAAGTYSVTVTDANGCTTTAIANVNNTGGASVTITSTTNVLCFGQSTGAINITASGGVSPYTYLWSNGSTTEDISGLAAGTYNVIVTDGGGCTTSAGATITQPASPLNTGAVASNATCGASNGSVNLTVTGGTSPYTFLWSNGATTEDISGLASGTYNVTVTDANGCTASAGATVSSIPVPVATVTGTTNVLCFGQGTGAINITMTGGTIPYTFLWSNGAVTEDISGLAAGTYGVTVTDASGCTATAGATISQPVGALNASAVATNATCGASNGSINLTVTGGTSPYTYLWSNGAATEDINNLAAGTYSVTITDANGCTATASASVNNTGGPGLTIAGTTNVLCFGQATGSIDITVSGGTAPYTFLWSNGAATEDINGLAAGTYTVSVTDANGCSTSASASITQPASAVTASAAGTNATCGNTNGSINLTVTGGTLPYSYLWSNGATTEDINGLAAGTYSVTVTDANGCIATTSITITNLPGPGLSVTSTNVSCFGQSTGSIDLTVTGGTAPYTYLWSNGSVTEDINGLAAGTYSVTVTDANGCTANISRTITQPASAVAAGAVATNATCSNPNGSIDLTVTGGTTPYTYLWSNGATTEDISGLAAGTYNVTVTDANGCTQTTSATVNNIAGPAVAITGTTNVLCFGQATGAIDITVNGGTAPFTFLWSNGATTEDINGLAAGTYSVAITDANGCTATISATITQPAQLVASESHIAIPCFGGNSTVTISATGGTAPYTGTGTFVRTAGTYSFTVTDANGCTATTSVIITQPVLLTASSSAGTISCNGGNTTVTVTAAGGTAPYTGTGTFVRTTGTYSFTVTDANGCTATTSVTITQPVLLTASSSAGTISCNGGNTTVTVTATGGTAPYTGTGTFARAAGTYTFTVTDANGCTASTTITVTQPAVLVALSSAAAIACNGGSTTITVTATGGTAPYTGTGSFVRTAGTYSFTVTDANGCTSATTIAVTQPSVLVAAVSAPPLTVCGEKTLVTVTATGGTTNYPYPGVGTYLRGPGTWDFIVSDANGCTATTQITIEAPDCLKIYPNPARGTLYVNHSKAKKGTVIQIFDIIGRRMMTTQIQENAVLTMINIDRLAGGSYILVFFNEDEKRKIRFGIQ